MKSLPFNACDYRCDRCLVTAECAVFQTLKQRTLSQERPPEHRTDRTDELDDIRNSFRETEDMIKQKAADLGIDIDQIAGGSTAAEIEAQRRKSDDDPLYARSRRLSANISSFLCATEPLQNGDEKEYFGDLAWHHAVICAKIYRATGWSTDGEIADDAKNSAAVAVNSLTITIMALDHLASRIAEIREECRTLSAEAGGIKTDIKARFRLGLVP